MLITLNILARRATSQKRPLDDFDQPEASGSSSNAYSSFAAAYAMNDQKPVIVENQQPTYLGNNGSAPISLINDSPVFGPALPPSQQQQQQQQMDTTSLNYGFGHSDSSMNWTASSDTYSHEFTNALGYGGHTAQPTIDPSFMAYNTSVGSLMNLQGQGDSPPLSAFPVQGLPFPGLDFIRNYNPGVDDNNQDGVWPSFDGGEFLYDPALQFSFNDQPSDNTNGHQ